MSFVETIQDLMEQNTDLTLVQHSYLGALVRILSEVYTEGYRDGRESVDTEDAIF